ncbi:hypothetical protein VTL71DRAFT_1104 [Oculimacula yallundae]|uniref:Transposase n=1 Tax=Oculimacula yallundae TaxID=86028 RepID=A0ABR4D309_9HELO
MYVDAFSNPERHATYAFPSSMQSKTNIKFRNKISASMVFRPTIHGEWLEAFQSNGIDVTHPKQTRYIHENTLERKCKLKTGKSRSTVVNFCNIHHRLLFCLSMAQVVKHGAMTEIIFEQAEPTCGKRGQGCSF